MTIKKQMWIIQKENEFYTGHGISKFSEHLEEAILFDGLDMIPVFEDAGECSKSVNVSVELN